MPDFISIKPNQFINTRYIKKITFKDDSGEYVILMDDGSTLKTTYIEPYIGMRDIADKGRDLPWD